MNRFLKISFLTLLFLLSAAGLGLWLGQDRIIALFVAGLNEHLAVPVRASRLEVSVLDQFPRLSVTLHDVVMSGSRPQDTTRLLRARRLFCAFDATDLLAGRYRIRAITLADGQVNVRRDAGGRIITTSCAPTPRLPPMRRSAWSWRISGWSACG